MHNFAQRGSLTIYSLMLMTLMLGAMLGCSGKTDPAVTTGKDNVDGGEEAASTDVHKTYAAADLPSVEEKLPPADQGRVVITLPTGWKTLQRKPNYLVACIPDDSEAAKLPRIAVTVGDAPADITDNTTPENAAEHAQLLQAQLVKDKKKWIETCKPLGLGDHTWIRHVRSAKLKDEYSAVQSLQTVRGGRLYTVELTVNAKENRTSSKPPILYSNAMQAHKEFAYTVAAHMQFPKENGSSPAPVEAPPPAEAVPGEKAKPDSDKPDPEKSE